METEQGDIEGTEGGEQEVAPARSGDVSTGGATVNVQELDSERNQTVTGEGVGAAVKATFDLLRTEVGDIDELKVDGVYSQLTAEHIRELDPVARRIIHNARVATALAEKAATDKVAAAEAKIAEKTEFLRGVERDLTNRQAQFAAIARNPELKALLNVSETDLGDPLSEKGIEKRIALGVAKGLKALLEPMEQTAAAEAGRQRYLDFVDKHPEMKDAAFKGEVAAMVRARAEAKTPISTEDAYDLVRGRRAVAAHRAQADLIAQARHESADHTQQRTVHGTPGGEDVPRDVLKRGAAAVAGWLIANPQAAARIRAENG